MNNDNNENEYYYIIQHIFCIDRNRLLHSNVLYKTI